jgi:hypothetical protein
MDALYNQTFHHLDKAFRKLEAMVPPPQKVTLGDGFVFRYKEKTIRQALVQKLARVFSGLHAARLLFENGFVQEQAAIQRMLDEFHEDILFLASAVIQNDQTPLHQKYLDAFYKEEFNDMVPRKKIRAYIARIIPAGDPSTTVTSYRSIHSVYSGFVHGASPQIMDMLEGAPPRFRIHGMSGTSRHEEHRYDLYNPFFRAIISFAVASKAFGDDELCQKLHAYHLEFDKLSGRNEAYRGESAKQPRSARSRPTHQS